MGVSTDGITLPLSHDSVDFVRPGDVLSNLEFLYRVEAADADVRVLRETITQAVQMHNHILVAPESYHSQKIESLAFHAQNLATSIKDQIGLLERDAVRSRGSSVKDTQVKLVKSGLNRQLQDYQREEASFAAKRREQLTQKLIATPAPGAFKAQGMTEPDWEVSGRSAGLVRGNSISFNGVKRVS